MIENHNQPKRVLILITVLGLVLLTIGGTYAIFTYVKQGEKENVLKTGTLDFVYDEEKEKMGNVINVKNGLPMSDEEGKSQETDGVFEFNVKATTQGAPIYYEIYLTKDSTSTIPENHVRVYLTEEGKDLVPTSKKEVINSYRDLGISQLSILKEQEGKTLYQGTIDNGQANYQKTYKFRMWLDENANATRNGEWVYGGMNFSVKVNVYASNEELAQPKELYEDGTGANIPDLVEGLIPVTFDTNDKAWKKADVTKEWYDYAKWNWANAVTVEQNQRDSLMKAAPGTEIPMEAINTMWVWIPRYEYDYVGIKTVGGTPVTSVQSDNTEHDCYANPGAIDIKFLSETNNSQGGNYKLHPAFTFGTQELEGFWYAKFEPSSKETCTIKETVENTDCDSLDLTLQIKPNAISWQGIRISTAFLISQNMNSNVTYGFGKTSDVHMSKNNEWGAVAYLSQSEYGKYGNPNYTEANKEIYVNKSNTYVTGNSNGTPSTKETKEGEQYKYDDLTPLGDGQGLAGPGASTTGTVYGIYDMSGGAWERVMGVIEDEEGNPRSGETSSINSGYRGKIANGEYITGRDLPESKYYELYSYGSTVETGCNGNVCYGEALSETSGWYDDRSSWLKISGKQWLMRGGYPFVFYQSGIFGFSGTDGQAYPYNTFRLTLTP